MTTPQLPARPNLEQLKRQAKDLLRSANDPDPAVQLASRSRFRVLPALAAKSEAELNRLKLALHDAQSVIAREHGFASWNLLRERVDELTLQFEEAAADFTHSVVDQRIDRARRLLDLHPTLVSANLHAALVTGNVGVVRAQLEKNPAFVTQRGGPLEWEPLLYVAHSGWVEKNSSGLVAVADLLLERGADPNTSYPWRENPKMPLSVLWAAACHARHHSLARVLLEAGAHPDDGESVYHAAENGDLAMLDLLATHGAQADGGSGAEPWGNTPLYFILGHHAGLAHDADIRHGAQWLLDHGANPNRVCYPDKSGETPLHAAARHWDAALIELLLSHGADLRVRRADGRTPLTLAELNGRTSAAAALRAHGAVDELTPPEKFAAACMRGDRETAQRLYQPAFVAEHANLLAEATRHEGTAALEAMLACDFDVSATHEMGATALHWAAFTGNAAAVRLLLAHGASVTSRDATYKAPPLGWCRYASLNQSAPRADFAGVTRALLAAGAPFEEDDPGDGSEGVLEAIAEFRRGRGEC